MKKLLSIIFIGLFGFAGVAFALPYFSSTQTLVPFQDGVYDLGTSTARFRNIFLSGTCTGCSAGSQTPWGQAIDGAGYALTNGGMFTLTNILATSTTASSTFPILHSTYASTTQLDVTGTATTTFGGDISLGHPYFVTTHGLRGDASDGLYVTANNYTAVANFGVGNSSNSVFSGAVNVTGNLGVLTGSTLTVADLTSAITLTNGSGVFAKYTGTSCTNQFVRSLSALGAATCASVANTDLTNSSVTVTAGGGLAGGGSVALGSSVTLTNPYQISTSSPSIGQLAYYTSASPTTLGSVATGTISGADVISVTASRYAIGGAASFSTTPGTFGGSSRYTFPQDLLITGNSTTTGATTTTSYVSAGLTQGNLNGFISATTTKGFNIASTTLDASGKSFNLGTSTFLLANDPRPLTLIGFYCTASTTGTAIVNFSHDNGNKTENQVCTSGSFTRTLTNNTWTANEAFNVQASSTAGTVNRITVTPSYYYTSN